MTSPSLTSIRTHDGTVLARDPTTGIVASGKSLDKAVAELRRLLSQTSRSAA
ncbi:hypothetical protein QEZ48_14740 [Aquamicrobium lusatiense]|uniref:hypothetical protein n=1 Tax=Aquamicrobium lusatiense TaxID=89772 RepID=UPI002455BE22|nr:hypothetical protein [Aquamicrobium lusatiense]MDH4992075.1 hypothetical protein [Aquamicrobium lusatiense]